MLRLKGLKWLFPLFLGVALASMILVAPAALASGISVSPTSGWVGMTFWVTASGYHPYEGVATWVGRPDGAAVGTGSTTADETGTISYPIYTASGWPLGTYQVVARGNSGFHLGTSFTLYGPAAPTPTPTTTPVGVAEPTHHVNDYSGRTLYYTGAHYKPGELVWVWYITPNRTTVSFGKVYANAFGNVYFPVTLGTDWMFGPYDWAAKGQESNHLTRVIFSYFDRQISDMVASDPVMGQPVWYQFAASGFKAWEKVNMWIDGPGGLHKDLPQTNADGNGYVVWTTYVESGMPCGNYRIVAVGLQSQHLVYKDNYYCY